MFYSVVPHELEGELLETLTAHYAAEPDVTVILERRRAERRRRSGPGVAAEQRELRDRRRRRVCGELPPLFGERTAAE
jgi:hypothetical protein